MGLTQAQRNGLYGALTAIGTVLVAYGVISENDLSQLMIVIGAVGTILSTALAWWKSRPSKVTVIDAPASDITVTYGGHEEAAG